jgi:hypothetical protein
MHEAASYMLVRARRATFESEEGHPATLERDGNTRALKAGSSCKSFARTQPAHEAEDIKLCGSGETFAFYKRVASVSRRKRLSRIVNWTGLDWTGLRRQLQRLFASITPIRTLGLRIWNRSMEQIMHGQTFVANQKMMIVAPTVIAWLRRRNPSHLLKCDVANTVRI